MSDSGKLRFVYGILFLVLAQIFFMFANTIMLLAFFCKIHKAFIYLSIACSTFFIICIDKTINYIWRSGYITGKKDAKAKAKEKAEAETEAETETETEAEAEAKDNPEP